MSYTIRQLGSGDNQQLLALSESRNTGSMLFTTDRKPDFFALSAELGMTNYFGIFKDNDLIGSIGICRQTRFINSKPTVTSYLFDLKVHPEWSGKTAYYRLMQHVVAFYSNIEKANWMFSTILDTNENIKSLTKGSLLFPNGKLLGKNYHVGLPVFMPQWGMLKDQQVQQISPHEAWAFYKLHASSLNFAPAEKEIFLRENGFFLACFEEKKITAITKVVDQSHARKIILTQRQPPLFRLLNLLCRFYKCPLLPRQGQEFKHGYLSYYVTATGKDYRKNFLKYVQEKHPGMFSYLFCGMAAKEAAAYRKPWLIKFTSSTYGYGDLPPDLSLDAVELTLI